MSVTVTNESHPSSSGGSSSLYGGEILTQPSPAKPTWAQILNSHPNPPSNAAAASSSTTTTNSANNSNPVPPGNNTPSSSSPSSQHSVPTKNISPSASGTLNMSGTRGGGYLPNFYDQSQSSMNWPLKFNQNSSWMINDDDSQRPPTNSSQDNTQMGRGDAFDRLESSSPTDWNKPVPNNSTANGWSSFQQTNPSRSNPTNNQWPEMNNIYGANTPTDTFNLSQANNDNTNSSTTWQDPSSSNATDVLTSTSNNSKHKASSIAASITGALKSAIALTGNTDLLGENSDSMINYVPQPKLVEQLGWDEPEINVTKRANFDDGTSIWGDPMECVSVPVKKWTNGTKAALTNATNMDLQQPPPPPQQQQQQQQQPVQKPVPTAATSRMPSNDENWPRQQISNVVQPPAPMQSSASSQWNDTSSVNHDQPNPSHQQNYRAQPSHWNHQSQSGDDSFLDGVVDTSDWNLQGPPRKTPFDPYEGQVDTSGWGISSGGGGGGGMPGQMPMGRPRFMNEYDPNDNPHDVRLPSYDNDPYRPSPDLKNPMMNHPGFPPRPNTLYPHQQGNILRPINPNGGLSTPPGAMIGQGSHSSPKLPTASPIPNAAPFKGVNPSFQASTPPQPAATGNGNNTNNSGAVHAQIMQQFRLAVQAGLISQDLLNTKLPPYMLQLLQRLFELQQKFQQFSMQLSELGKNKGQIPVPFLQSEYDRLTKAIQQKKQEMLIVQKEIQEAHGKIKQQSTNPTPTPSQMLSNTGPNNVGSNVDQSRLNQWTKQSTIGGQRSSMFPPPPGLSQKDWQTDNNDPNENWDSNQTNESNTNQVGNMDSHSHNNQASAFGDPFSNLVDEIDGPPPFIPGQLWNWKPSMPNAEDDPHATPGSFPIGPKGSPMGHLNVGGAESAFSNPQFMHAYQRQMPPNRSQLQQGSLHDQQAFQPAMNDWMKQQQQQQQQYRGASKAPPPPHPSFGGNYRPYM